MDAYQRSSEPTPFVLPNIAAGIINLWSGSIANIPGGWFLCDGNNGTPDLTDRFVVAAGTSYLRGIQSGGLSHYHEFSGSSHQHDLDMPPTNEVQAGTQVRRLTDPSVDPGDTDPTDHSPEWYSIAYVMKA